MVLPTSPGVFLFGGKGCLRKSNPLCMWDNSTNIFIKNRLPFFLQKRKIMAVKLTRM